jgi:RND family efflux transporter MFP subunit
MIIYPVHPVRALPGKRAATCSAILGVLMITFLAACGKHPDSGNEDAGQGGAPAILEVETRVVSQRTEVPTFVAAGVVAPVRRARMGTRQAGNVEQVMVRPGDAVAAGQPILRVDARDLETALQAARLQRQTAQTAWETARRNRERFRRLYDQQLIAKARLEEAELAAEEARARLEQAEAEVGAVEVNLDYATLRAPFAGVVSEVLADVGTFVAPGPPLAVFEDRSRMEINVGVAQAKVDGLAVGKRLQVGIENRENKLEGRVQAVLPALEAPGVGQILRLVVEDPPPGLKPGMVAEVHLPALRPEQPFVVIPASAIIQRGQLDGVFVVEEGTAGILRAHLHWITVTPSSARADTDEIRILSGLQPGDRIVVGEAVETLVDGQPIKLARL